MPVPNLPDVYLTGDRIVCEQGRDPGGFPRWNMNLDLGGNGKTLGGVVVRITPTTILTRLDNGWPWDWPHAGHPDFDPSQWTRPGFMQYHPTRSVSTFTMPADYIIIDPNLAADEWHMKDPVPQQESKVKALQKRFIGKTNDQDCECGGWAIGAGHSTWCRCHFNYGVVKG